MHLPMLCGGGFHILWYTEWIGLGWCLGKKGESELRPDSKTVMVVQGASVQQWLAACLL